MSRRARPKFGSDVVVQDMGSGYSVAEPGSRAYRVALRCGPGASATDLQRVKRAAVKQLGRLVAQAGEVYDSGHLTEREYVVDGRWVWELSWSRKRAPAQAAGGGVGNGRRAAPLAGRDAGRGGEDAGGDRG